MNFKLVINLLKYIFLLFISLGKLSFLSKLNNHILYKGKCQLKVRFSTYSSNNNLRIEKKVKGSLRIKISGNNNSVEIGEKCVFDNLKIRIVGDNNKIIFGEGTSFGRNGTKTFALPLMLAPIDGSQYLICVKGYFKTNN